VLFEDSIFSPPLLPSRLTKPRIVCFCQPVVSMICASVAPLARFIIAMTEVIPCLHPRAQRKPRFETLSFEERIRDRAYELYILRGNQ
jgi:hypothetical protein